MRPNASVRFFDEQFRHQLAAHQFELNPFEIAALPHIHGTVLEYGCGLGNLAVAAARRGYRVVALDGSQAAIEHLRTVANREALSLRAEEADLRTHELTGEFDSVICIGLLMFFDCPTAYRRLDSLLSHVRAGGVAVINVLTQGTTYMGMFSPEGHCLFKQEDLTQRFSDWEVLNFQHQEFPAPGNTRKVFATVVARKPHAARTDALYLENTRSKE